MTPWYRRHREDPPTTPSLQAAEHRTDDLEERADRVAESLRERMRRNNFAEGIAQSWGQVTTPRHRQEPA